MSEIINRIEKLSLLASETNGAAFYIQHVKESGKFKVVFNNCLSSSKEYLQPKEFTEAIDDAINWLTSKRIELRLPFRYTIV